MHLGYHIQRRLLLLLLILVALLLLAALGRLLSVSLALEHLTLPVDEVGDLLARLAIDG